MQPDGTTSIMTGNPSSYLPLVLCQKVGVHRSKCMCYMETALRGGPELKELELSRKNNNSRATGRRCPAQQAIECATLVSTCAWRKKRSSCNRLAASGNRCSAS